MLVRISEAVSYVALLDRGKAACYCADCLTRKIALKFVKHSATPAVYV